MISYHSNKHDLQKCSLNIQQDRQNIQNQIPPHFFYDSIYPPTIVPRILYVGFVNSETPEVFLRTNMVNNM